jgi:hypothetical protein
MFAGGLAAWASEAGGGVPTARATAGAPADVPETGSLADTCIVFYFHRTLRCYTCLGLEAAAREAVHEGFLADLNARTLAWRAVDFDLPENAHFVEEFDLEGSSLVFAKKAGGRTISWEKIEGIWNLANEPEPLKAFVAGELWRFFESAKPTGAPYGGSAGETVTNSSLGLLGGTEVEP